MGEIAERRLARRPNPFNEGVLFANLPDWYLIGPPSLRFVSKGAHLEQARALTDCGTRDRRGRIHDDSATVRHLRADTVPASAPPEKLWAAIASDLGVEPPAFLETLEEPSPFGDMRDALASAGAWVQIIGSVRLAERAHAPLRPAWRTFADFILRHAARDRSWLRRLRSSGLDELLAREVLDWLVIPLDTASLEVQGHVARVLHWAALLEVAQRIAMRDLPPGGDTPFCCGAIDVSFERFVPTLDHKQNLVPGTRHFLEDLNARMATRWAVPAGRRERSQRTFCDRLELYHGELDRKVRRAAGLQPRPLPTDRRSDAWYERMQAWKCGEKRFDSDAFRDLIGATDEPPTAFTTAATMIGIADDLARHLKRDLDIDLQSIVWAFARYPIVRDRVHARFEHFERTGDLVVSAVESDSAQTSAS